MTTWKPTDADDDAMISSWSWHHAPSAQTITVPFTYVNQDVIDILTGKKGSYLDHEHVELTNFTPGHADWKPHLHPRNKDGKFVRKGVGTYLFGKAKKAVFGKHSFELNPGDEAFHNPTMGSLRIKHADGTVTLHKDPDNPSVKAFGGIKKFNVDDPFIHATDEKIKNGSLKPIPEKAEKSWEVPASTEAHAKAALMSNVKVGGKVNKSQMAFLPRGSRVTTEHGTDLVKGDDHGWIDVENNTNYGTWVADGLLTVQEIGDGESQKDSQTKKDIENLAKAKAGNLSTDEAVQALKEKLLGMGSKTADKSINKPETSEAVQALKEKLLASDKEEDKPSTNKPVVNEQSMTFDGKTVKVGDHYKVGKGGSKEWKVTSIDSDGAFTMEGGGAYKKHITPGDNQWKKMEKIEPSKNIGDEDHSNDKVDEAAVEKALGTFNTPSGKLTSEDTAGMADWEKDLTPKVGDPLKSAAEFDALPEGSKVKHKTGKIYTKNSEGQWNSPAGGAFDSQDFIHGLGNWSLESLGEEKSGFKVGDIVGENVESLNALPAGTVINYHTAEYTKQSDGKWLTQGGQKHPASAMVVGGGLTIKSLPEKKNETSGPKVGDSANSIEALDALPVGTQVNQPGFSNNKFYEKNSEGKWVLNGSTLDFDAKDFGFDGNPWKVSKVPDTSSGQKNETSGLKVGDKVGTTKQSLENLPIGSQIKYGGVSGLSSTSTLYTKNKNGDWVADSNPHSNYDSGSMWTKTGFELIKLPDDDKNAFEKSGPKVGDSVKGSELFDMPVGTKATWNKAFPSKITKKENPYGKSYWEHDVSGDPIWDSAIQNAEKSFTLIKVGGDKTADDKSDSSSNKPSVGPKVGDKVGATKNSLDVLPVGTKVKYGSTTYEKLDNGKWLPEGYDLEHTSEDMVIDSGLTISHLPNNASEKAPEPPQGFKKPEPVAVEGKKNKLTSANPEDAPEPNGELTKLEGYDDLNSVDDFLSPDQGFVHPVSGDSFPLEKGDQLLQHKITPTNFAVIDKDGNKKYTVNKFGKEYKWGNHIPKSNYKSIFTANKDYGDKEKNNLPDVNDYIKGNTFIHPNSKQNFAIEEGQVLMQHNFTPHSYVVTNDKGDMLYKIDVNGNKQKAGTNLKISNYHEAFTKPEPKDLTDSLNPHFNASEVEDFLNSADPGDHFKIGLQHMTKGSDGVWKNSLGSIIDINNIKTYVSIKNADKNSGKKSSGGVPLHKDELTTHLQDAPVGTKIEVPGDGQNSGLVLQKNADSSWDSVTPSGSVNINDNFGSGLASAMLLGMGSKLVPNMTQTAPPKKTTNDHGVPVYEGKEAMKTALDAQPVGTSLYVMDGMDWEKQSDGKWTYGGIPWGVEELANMTQSTGWKNLQPNLKFVAPKIATHNEHGFPKKANDIKEYLDKLPIGSKVGTDSTTTATKITSGIWKDDHSQNEKSSGVLGDKWGNISSATHDKLKLISTPSGASGDLANKMSQPPTPTVSSNGKHDFAAVNDFLAYFKSNKGQHSVEKEMLKAMGDPTTASYYQTNPMPLYSPEENLPYLAKPELVAAIDNAIDNIDAAKAKFVNDLDKSGKTLSTKYKNKLQAFKKMALAAQKLSIGELPEKDDISPSLNFGSEKVNWPFEMYEVQSVLDNMYGKVKFKNESANLGFDPFNATSDEYLEYLKKDDNFKDWVHYLPESHLKSFTLKHLGAPGSGKLTDYNLNEFKSIALKNQFGHEASEALKAKNGQPFVPKIAPNKSFPSTPSFLTDDQWNAVQFALSTDAAQDFPASNISKSDITGQFGEHFSEAIPQSAVDAIAVALSKPYIDNQLIKTLSYLLVSGLWNGDAMSYEAPEGKFQVSPGMKVYKGDGNNYSSTTLFFVPKDFNGDGSVSVWIDHSQKFGTSYLYSSTMDSLEELYTAPYDIKIGDAIKDGHSFDVKDWDYISSLESKLAPKEELTGPEAVTLSKILKDKPFVATDLTPKAQTLILESPSNVDIVLYKDSKGHYRQPQSIESMWSEFVDSLSNSDLKKVKDPSNSTEVSEFVKGLDDIDLDNALTTMGRDPEDYGSLLERRMALRQALTNWANDTKASPPPVYVPPPTGIQGSLKALPELHMGGGQTKTYFADANGQTYLGKPNTHEKFRPDAEQAAGDIGRLFGFKVPASTVRDLDGQYTHIQKIINATGDLTGTTPDKLSDKTLIQAMSGHVLDWGVSNHDAHGGNFLLDDNDDINKIDLGQAWKALGSDKLAVGWELPGNYGGVWYEKFYRSIEQSKVDKTRLDAVTKAVLSKAYTFSSSRDDAFREYLNAAFKNRTFWPKGHTKESFIEMAMKRKKDTFNDFLKFYGDMYKKGGYDYPFTEEAFNLPTLPGTDAHTKLSSHFAEEVGKKGIHGKSLFFSSSEVEDAHAFFYSVKGAKDGKVLLGDMRLRKDADKKFEAWAAPFMVNSPKPVAVKEGVASNSLPNTNEYHSALVALAKTTSTHASDGAYNQSTISQAKTKQEALKSAVTTLENDWKNQGAAFVNGKQTSSDPFTSLPNFESGHQQYAWYEWAKDTLKQFDDVFEAQQSAQKAPQVSAAASYTAPNGVDIKSKTPNLLETLTSPDGKEFKKYSDWNFVGPDGPISQSEYEALQTGTGWKTVKEKVGDEKKTEEVIIAAPPKYKVTRGNFSTPRTTPSDNDGVATYKDQQEHTNYSFESYHITSENYPGIKLQYVAHSMAGHHNNLSNQGRMQILVEDWDGSENQMDAALSMIRDMGVDLSQADEQGLELFYWRHLSGILQNRNLSDSKEIEARDAVKKIDKAKNLGVKEELEQRKAAFAALWGQEIVDKADWRPQFSNHRAHLTVEADDASKDGHPYWMRPDFDLNDFEKWSGGILPSRNDSTGIEYLVNGGYTSNEDKIRYTGKWGDSSASTYGVGSANDDRNKGSGGFAYVRQQQFLSKGVSGMYVEPTVMGRTSNYSFYHDNYGDVADRVSESPFSFKGLAQHGSGKALPGKKSVGSSSYGSNETMIKYGWSLWDDIAILQAKDATERKNLLEYFAKKGIKEIRGIPIEDRIVLTAEEAQKIMERIWELAREAAGIENGGGNK